MKLSERMLAAADELEHFSNLYEAYSDADYPWSANDLRREAAHVAEEES